MVRRKYLVNATFDEEIYDPETVLVFGVFYPKKPRESLLRRMKTWLAWPWRTLVCLGTRAAGSAKVPTQETTMSASLPKEASVTGPEPNTPITQPDPLP